MKLSVSILSWNNFKVLHDTLHNLSQDLKGIDSEIIIVDNGSTDGCEKLATIANGKNLGISIGKNQGIEACKGEFVLMLDADVLYVPGSISCFMEWLLHFPDEYAIGFYPNKFSNQRNSETQRFHEGVCYELFNPVPHTATCIFYGMFKKSLLDLGIRCPTEGPFDEVGYGWEDMDFFMQMKSRGIDQWVAGLNHATGKYYHDINSSIKQMGQDTYIRSSRERGAYFKEKWNPLLTSISTR